MTQNIYLSGIDKQQKLPVGVIYPAGIGMSNDGMDIYAIRLENLRALAVLAGGRPALAKALGMSYALLQNYVGKTPTKRIGDKTARTAETVFSLEHGWMDATHETKQWIDRVSKNQNDLADVIGDQAFTFFSRHSERFARLPADRWQRIEGFALGVLEEWEAAEGSRKMA